jgi:hypothetical protein
LQVGTREVAITEMGFAKVGTRKICAGLQHHASVGLFGRDVERPFVSSN